MIIAVILCAAAAFSAVLLFSYAKESRQYKNAPLSLSEDFTVTGHTGCMGEKDNSIEAMEAAVTKELCAFFHTKGMLVSVYTVNGYNEIYRVLAAAPDNITSRNPDRVLEIINEKSK